MKLCMFSEDMARSFNLYTVYGDARHYIYDGRISRLLQMSFNLSEACRGLAHL